MLGSGRRECHSGGFLSLQCYLNRVRTLRTSQPLPKPQPQMWKSTYSFSHVNCLPPQFHTTHLSPADRKPQRIRGGRQGAAPGKTERQQQPKAEPRDGQIPQRNRGRSSAKGSKGPSHYIRAGVRGSTKEGLRETQAVQLWLSQCLSWKPINAKPLTANSPVSLMGGGGGY